MLRIRGAYFRGGGGLLSGFYGISVKYYLHNIVIFFIGGVLLERISFTSK